MNTKKISLWRGKSLQSRAKPKRQKMCRTAKWHHRHNPYGELTLHEQFYDALSASSTRQRNGNGEKVPHLTKWVVKLLAFYCEKGSVRKCCVNSHFCDRADITISFYNCCSANEHKITISLKAVVLTNIESLTRSSRGRVTLIGF